MIVAAGHTAYDHLFNMKEFPPLNGARRIDNFFDGFGGGAANFSMAVSKLGSKATLFSCVGEDFAGSDYEAALMQQGVDIKSIQRAKSKTAHAWMYNDYGSNHRCYFYWGSSEFLKDFTIPEGLIKKAGIVQFIADAPEFVLKNAELIRSTNPSAEIAVDPSYDMYTYSKDDLIKLLDLTDYLFLNEHEYKDFKRITGLLRENVVEKLKALVVSEGARGCSIFFDGEDVQVPVSKVDVKDPFGAGDAHRAGFMVAKEKGYDLPECVKIGNIVASFVVQHQGCQTGQPTWEQVEEKLE